jgi:hypothetical protein
MKNKVRNDYRCILLYLLPTKVIDRIYHSLHTFQLSLFRNYDNGLTLHHLQQITVARDTSVDIHDTCRNVGAAATL